MSINQTALATVRCRRGSLAAVILGLTVSGALALAESPSAGDAELFDRLDADSDGRITSREISAGHERLFSRLLRRADADDDKSLTREEFLAGLVPSRPDKPLEERLPSTFPQADAVRWLLLTLDADGNSRIEADEVPDDMQAVFESMLNRIDANKNGDLERNELGRGGPPLAQIAGRYVRQNKIDVAKELERLEKQLGPAANRFDQPPVTLANLADPRRAREVFARLDGNGNGQIERREIPEQLQQPIQRLMRRGDRDGDGRVSEREFVAGAKRMAQRQARQADMDKRLERPTSASKSVPADE